MQFNRQTLLRILESCSAGLNTKDSAEQSSCFVFNEGVVTTYNGEILCQALLCNDEGEKLMCHGALPAKPLVETLRKSPDEILNVVAEESSITIKGTGRKQRLTMSTDVLLDISEVEKPSVFTDLPPVFSEALALAAGITAKKDDNFALNCIAVTPKGLQATNRHQALRYLVATGRDAGTVLVRGESIKPVTGLGLAKASYGTEFVWFQTYSGTRVAVRLLDAEYPNLSEIFSQETVAEFEMPRTVADVVQRAIPFVAENASGKIVDVRLADHVLTVRAQNAYGDFYEEKQVTYAGKPIGFTMNPESLAELLRSNGKIEVTPASLRTKGDGYCLVVSAEVEL